MPLLEAPINANVRAGANTGATVAKTAVVDALVLDASAEEVTYNQKPIGNTVTTYKIKSGDTISGIAEAHGISVNTILWANNLNKSSKLSVGQTLVILPISGVRHKVASGDTLDTIAAKYKGDIDEIIAYNDIEGDRIKIGQSIVIPSGELPSAQQSARVATAANKVANVALGVSLASASEGYYTRPINGGVKTQGIHGYNGVDLAASCGNRIYASAAGIVEVSAGDGLWNGGFGNYVVISHSNGAQTLYAHMQDTIALAGARVEKGAVIGTIGATGKVQGTTGCHVHFEIRNGARNPF